MNPYAWRRLSFCRFRRMRLVLNQLLSMVGVARSVRGGKCAICGKDKSNLTDHHIIDSDGKKTGDKLVMCRDCHTVIEQYRQAIKRLSL